MSSLLRSPSTATLKDDLTLVEHMLETGQYPAGLHLLRLLRRRLENHVPSTGPAASAPRVDSSACLVLDRALELVREGYRTATLASVAEELGVSEVYLSVLIKRRTGKTFKAHQVRRRIEVAQALLRDPFYKVYEVAELVGYSDPKYFSRMFRDHTGLTPSQYRNHGE